MIILRKQYICDFTGKKSFDKNKFLVLTLYAGREFDGCHQYEDVHETFHIHKSVVEKTLGDVEKLPKDTEREKQLELTIKLHRLQRKFLTQQ